MFKYWWLWHFLYGVAEVTKDCMTRHGNCPSCLDSHAWLLPFRYLFCRRCPMSGPAAWPERWRWPSCPAPASETTCTLTEPASGRRHHCTSNSVQVSDFYHHRKRQKTRTSIWNHIYSVCFWPSSSLHIKLSAGFSLLTPQKVWNTRVKPHLQCLLLAVVIIAHQTQCRF